MCNTDYLWLATQLLFSEKYKDACKLADKLRNNIDSVSDDCVILKSRQRYKTSDFFNIIGCIYGCTPDRRDTALECYKQYHLHLVTPYPKAVTSDRVVYSFRPFNEHTRTDLLNKTLTIASPLRMNDPFDTLLYDFECARTKHRQDNQKFNKNLLSRLLASEEIFRQSLHGYKIRCFSEKSPEGKYPFQNTLMWSHYASSHSGICIKYLISPSMQAKQTASGYQVLKKIKYIDKPINLTKTEIINGELALCCKHKDWQYENEVRLLTYSTLSDIDYFPMLLEGRSKISAIYFGLQCPEDHINTIKNILCYDRSILYYKMQKNYFDIYNLKEVPILS